MADLVALAKEFEVASEEKDTLIKERDELQKQLDEKNKLIAAAQEKLRTAYASMQAEMNEATGVSNINQGRTRVG